MKNKTWIVAVLGLGALAAQADILQNWQFNDAAGTLTKNAVNTGTPGDVSFSKGVGANNVINADGLAVNTVEAYVAQNFAMPTQITNGKVYLRVDYAYWNSFSSANTAVIGDMGFLDAAGNSVIQRLSKTPSPANSVNISAILTGQTAITGNTNMGMDNSTGISVILGVDLDNKKFSLWTDYGYTGAYTQQGVEKDFGTTALGNLTQFRYVTGGVNGTVRALDMVVVGTDFEEIKAIPEPATLGTIGFVAVSTLFIRRLMY